MLAFVRLKRTMLSSCLVKRNQVSFANCHDEFYRTKTEDTGTNDGHDPVKLSISRPSIPTEPKNGERQNVEFSGQETAYKRPTGTKIDPMNSAGIRISGVPTPPFLLASYKTKMSLRNP